MEKLIVNKFLILKNAEFEVRRINLIIGPQANGKSLLAKLLYFFKEITSETFLISVKNKDTQAEFTKKVTSLFENYFPKYTWMQENIDIEYIRDDIKITILKSNSHRTLKINYSRYFTIKFRQLKNAYTKFQKREKKDDFIIDDFWIFKEEYINGSENNLYPYASNSIFIPASRSFFANLQKNIFSFLAENIDIDPFMKEFGQKYEIAKKIYTDIKLDEKFFKKNDIYKKVIAIAEQILNGKYEYRDKQDWIKSGKNIINLANASSGQQESLPMLLILSIFPFFSQSRDITYFIEEPEAHLFPMSQKHIINLVGLLYNNEQNIVITTHSPYILTAFNNLFLAYEVKSKKGNKALKNIIDHDFIMNFDDVSSYTILNGTTETINDIENRLIGLNIIDSVSDDFNHVFDDLVSLI